MDTRQLAAFCAVVERKSFSQAARRLGISQPAVSLQIRSLEERLGRQLLDRSGRRVEPTEAGLRLYRSAQRMLALEEQLLDEVTEDGDTRLRGRLELGASSGPGETVLPLLLCEFQALHPDARIALSVSDTHTVVELVARRELELGVVGAARPHRSVVFEPFFRDELVLACPPDHAFAGGTISVDELRDERLILMQEGAGVRLVIEDELRAAGVRLRDLDVRLELGLQESVRSAVRAGHGVAFISRSAIESDLAAGNLSDATRAGVRRLRARARPVKVRWGLDALEPLLRELAIAEALLVTSRRWTDLVLPVARTFDGVQRHSPIASVQAAVTAAAGADGLVAVGGGSAIDTAKAVSAETGLPVVSVPSTYSGSEWTTTFGIRDEERGVKGGGSGATLVGIVYEPLLTLSLPIGETGGTALNALAHCAEALYVRGHNPDGDRHAISGARLIGEWLPRVLDDPEDRRARTQLMVGAAEAGEALALSGLALGHAMAQALGGRFGLPHGAANAICLPPALRFNRLVAVDALSRLGAALRGDAVERTQKLARLGGFERLRDLGVPEDELEDVAEAAAARGGARANPRPASAG